ncbi:hypothetical protein M2444_005600 [Paenibacillus sp. PastF-3]|uniref:hypothetical protein n=1 Tax=unclassified Paenibacillus TaxID=185978 RepID=UPI002473ADB7|nr:hypothetical protein [Paenibacillus sp. PastF-3]MDH6373757.1 hypothetical protein [Paenibacillus sp. PastF-3]
MINENHPEGRRYKQTLDEFNAKLVPLLDISENEISGKIKLHEARGSVKVQVS